MPKAKKKAGKPKPAAHAHEHARFDRAPYEPLPILDGAEAVALAKALLAKKPGKLPEAERLAAAVAKARGALGDDARSHDVAMDRAWLAFVRRIRDYSELPPERHTRTRDAQKVYAIVSDLSILRLNYLAEFAQIGARLDALRREGLVDDARDFAGAPFFDEVMFQHAEYGKALGIGGARDDSAASRLALLDALHDYVLHVLALARAGQPKTWDAVARALQPIVDLRQKQARAAHRAPPAPPAHPPVHA